MDWEDYWRAHDLIHKQETNLTLNDLDKVTSHTFVGDYMSGYGIEPYKLYSFGRGCTINFLVDDDVPRPVQNGPFMSGCASCRLLTFRIKKPYNRMNVDDWREWFERWRDRLETRIKAAIIEMTLTLEHT